MDPHSDALPTVSPSSPGPRAASAGPWPWPMPGKARTSSWSAAPPARWRRSTTRSGRCGGSATLLTLDLKAHDKIDALGPTIYQRWDKLDILVGNAGILGPLSPLGHVTADAWNEVLEINLTANWRLIRTLDPLLRRSEAGRAIFVSSGAATGPRAYWGPYAASKAGLEALVKVYADEVANTPVRANLRQSGADAHGHARQGLSRRGPGLAQAARSRGRDVRQARRGQPAPTTASCST